jgi:hypothetical protein
MAIPVRVICNLAVNKNLRRVGIEKKWRDYANLSQLSVWSSGWSILGLPPIFIEKTFPTPPYWVTVLGKRKWRNYEDL